MKMFRSMSGERHLSDGQSSSSSAGHGVTSPGLDSQESSWIGLLSVVSRPALSFLQKYLPGRSRTPAMSDKRVDWTGGDLKHSFVEEENEFLRQLDDIMPLTQHPAPQLTYLRCQHDGAAGLLEPKGGSTLTWLTAESLQELGIQSAEEMDLNLCQQTQTGYISSARTFLSHIRLSSLLTQEILPTGGKDWLTEAVSSSVKSSGGKSRTWWGSIWGGEESSQKGLLSDLSWTEEGTPTGQLCPQQAVAGTKAPAAETSDVFVQSGGKGWTLGENTRPTDHKDKPANNGGLQTVQNREGAMPDHRLSISNHLSGSEAATACSEVALLTPDQDNGYSSLEEEHFQMCHLYMLKPQGEEQLQRESTETSAATNTGMKGETSDEGESTSGKVDEEEGMQEDEEEQEAAALEGQAVEVTVFASPECQNKAIAFIMGCPCSDDDSSQSEGESSDDDDDDDDDDGFDSEGSSDLSDTDEDEDEDSDSDSEADSEAERLWSSLCQSVDPYNPRNFTARLHTSSTPPRAIPTSTSPPSTQSTPASSPDLTPLPLSLPPLTSSPPSGHDTWDDSTSASEADEGESLRLWSSFSCSSDPYSPFNFQAPLRTRAPAEKGPRTRAKKAYQTPPHPHCHAAASPPEYRKEEAEERLDSGFSEPSTSSNAQSCKTTKKVRFCDDVEEFFASCGEEEEDRRGPWEELARDRCRFLRRCQEVEQSIAYCLQPQHRSLVYQRLSVLCIQDA